MGDFIFINVVHETCDLVVNAAKYSLGSASATTAALGGLVDVL